jgi:Transposase IS66 family
VLTRWPAFTRFLGDGRICLSNNVAERSLRGIALGRRSWLFAGSDRGAARAAAIYTLIATAKLNDINPQALARRRAHPHPRSSRLPPPRASAVALEASPASNRRRLNTTTRLAVVLGGCLLRCSMHGINTGRWVKHTPARSGCS